MRGETASPLTSILGIAVALGVLFVVGQFILWAGWPLIIVFASVLLWGAGAWIISKRRDARAVSRFRDEWEPRGKDLLLVYSNSPHWQQYVETNWLSRWGSRAVVLNWSERSQWPDTSAAELFRRYGGNREFNPLAIIVPRTGRPIVLRFWQAFRDNKHGKPLALRAQATRLAAALENPR